MISRRFRFQCLVRVLFLVLSICGFVLVVAKTRLYAVFILLGLTVIYQVISLVLYVEKTNRELARFLLALRYHDFSQTFKDEKLGGSFDRLRQAFTEIMDNFRKIRMEKEEHYQYLQIIVQHVGIGLLAFQSNGDVELINPAAKKLFKVPFLKNIKALESFSPELLQTLQTMRPHQRALVKVETDGDVLNLALYSREFKLRDQGFTLVSIQNIQSELEEKEIESWQKLIRVLTHEIMNSITPIASLASTIDDLLEESTPQDHPAEPEEAARREALSDIHHAAQTIQKRSQGLLQFVDAYRNLTLIPQPRPETFPIGELFQRVEKLLAPQVREKVRDFRSSVEPEDLRLFADPALIEQVLINLLLNAAQAVEGQKVARISLAAYLDGQARTLIEVRDNGTGITAENIDKIFIPFFSTKEGGAGIGLSFSRQVMHLHRGSISVHSRPGEETVFTLRF
ncbi:MAG: ATP-binding protein [Candidatus Aminicenantes bacterium]|nr:ATP-binding protein [Candidatus Aminicenantes bacterium]